jgi:hypothetical protein
LQAGTHACRPVFFVPKRKPPRRQASPAASPPPPARSALILVVFLLTTAAAIAERWLFARAWNESRSLTSAFYYGDAPRFLDYASAILQGRAFDNGIPFHPPGWPLVLAAFVRLRGGALHGDAAIPIAAVKLFIACLSGLTVGVATVLGYEIAGIGAMLAVSLLGTFQFGHVVEGTVANSEALFSLCVIVTLSVAWRWLRPPLVRSWTRAALTGILAGCAMLVRAEFLAGAVLIAVVAWRARAPRIEIAAFVLCFCLVLAPATWWHWRTLDAFNAAHAGRIAGPLPRFAPVTSYGPFNFAMANHADADGGPNRDHPMLDRCNQETDARLSAGELDLQCPAVYDLYVHGYAIGAGWVLEHPGAALTLLGRKVGYTIGFLAQGYFIDDVGAGVDGTRRRVDLVDPSHEWMLPIHLGLLLAGLALMRRRTVALGLLGAPLVALLASVLSFYGYVRLGVAYLPVVWILQGTAIAAGLRRVVTERPVTSTTAGVVMATLLVLLGYDAVSSRQPRALVLDGMRTADGALVEDETLTIHRVR